MTTVNHTQSWPFPASGTVVTRSRAHTVALWVVSAAVAAMFLMAGGSKLAGAPMMVGLYDAIGVGQWFRYVTGAIEVGGAVALFIPALAFYAALALATTMIGAMATHLFIVGGSTAVPVLLLAATTFIAWTRWSRR